MDTGKSSKKKDTPPPKKSADRAVKAGVLIFVIVVLAALAYRFATSPVSVTTTFPSEVPSQATSLSSTSSVTSSVTASVTTPPVTFHLSADDFNMTSSEGCESVNQTLMIFTLYISNRFNYTVHFINETTAGSLIVLNSANQTVPIDLGESVQGHPHYIKVQTIILTVRLNVIPQGDTPLQLTFDVNAYVAEVNGPIPLSLTINMQRTFSTCSLV